MTPHMCYLLPLPAIRKIPSCSHSFNISSTLHTYRHKRFISDIISIGIGSAALALATRNFIHSLKLQHDIQAITKSLPSLLNTLNLHTAQLSHFVQGQMKFLENLNHTQIALNTTIHIVNQHSIAVCQHSENIQKLTSLAHIIYYKLDTFVHSVQTPFLHTSVSEILANRLNLHFIHPKDLPNILKSILTPTNISFTTRSTSIPLVELVTRLLVEQHVNFIPLKKSSDSMSSIIGSLSVSSFFATTSHHHQSFSIYKLLSIPFPYNGTRVRLANMPFLIGVDKTNGHLIRWSESESTSCDFLAMPVCRETPPVITHWNRSCLYQILVNIHLSACYIEPYHEPIFIHHIGNH